jgi:excisionase family DNA binding protein
MTDAPDFLRAGAIARLAGVSVRTVRRWIAKDSLPSVKLRGVRLVPRKDLERLLSPAPAPCSRGGDLRKTGDYAVIGKR